MWGTELQQKLCARTPVLSCESKSGGNASTGASQWKYFYISINGQYWFFGRKEVV
jgi:hypothetical protein